MRMLKGEVVRVPTLTFTFRTPHSAFRTQVTKIVTIS